MGPSSRTGGRRGTEEGRGEAGASEGPMQHAEFHLLVVLTCMVLGPGDQSAGGRQALAAVAMVAFPLLDGHQATQQGDRQGALLLFCCLF